MADNYGGFDHTFVDKDSDKYTCNRCNKILKDPHLTGCCGQHFCESCLKNWFTKQGQESCPHCRAEGEEFQHMLNKSLKRKIDSLKIHCINKKEGCQWTGELGSLKDHLESASGCGYVEVECPYKCEILCMLRKNFEKHVNNKCYLRPYQCEHCSFKGTYQSITGSNFSKFQEIFETCHYQQCPEFPLECPNMCGAKDIKKKDMKLHRSQCPEETVKCTYKCKKQQEIDESLTIWSRYYPSSIVSFELKRKYLAEHVKNECELRTYKCEYCTKKDTYKAITTKHYRTCANFPLECPNNCGVKDIKRKDMKDHLSQCPEEPVQCPFEEAGCKIKLVRRELEQHVSTTQQQHLLMVMGAYKEVKKELTEVLKRRFY